MKIKSKIIKGGIVISIITLLVVSFHLVYKKDIKKESKISLNTENLISYTIDGEMVKEKPSKESGYIANKISCKNGSNIVWDNDNWQVEMNAERIDRCTVDFTKDTAREGYRVTVTSSSTNKFDSTSKTTVNGGTIVIYPKEDTIGTVTGCSGIVEDNKVIVRNVAENQTCNITMAKSLADIILDKYTNITERTDFSNIEESTNLWKTTDYDASGSFTGTSYYYTGNPDNWVSFGKYTSDVYQGYNSTNTYTQIYTSLSECENATKYNNNCTKIIDKGSDILWRIVRINGDGSVRLLYAGSGRDDGYIGVGEYNALNYDDAMYVGWKYGTNGSLALNRTNENKSPIFQKIESWYNSNIVNTGLEKYISKTAIYCNDRSITSDTTYDSNGSFSYATYTRTQPTLECNIQDQFKVGFGLMTLDEVRFAGGKKDVKNASAYYYLNASGDSAISNNFWWTMSPSAVYASGNGCMVMVVSGYGVNDNLYEAYTGEIDNTYIKNQNAGKYRPVISLKYNVEFSEGDGSASNPYKIITN